MSSPEETRCKPLVLFAGLPRVLRQLRGRRSLREVAEGAGLAKEHLALLEAQESKRYGSRILAARPGKTPRLETLDALLRYYGVSLARLGELLEVQSGDVVT